jgi:NhaA family Na+:H+ antiporter
MITKLIRNFLRLQAAGGILLFGTAVLAVVFNNTDVLIPFYRSVFHAAFDIGPIHSHHSLTHWINDGLMVIFFFLVGMEIKREMLQGELSNPSSLVLPAIAAAGGMLVPGLIYVGLNHGNPSAMSGWAIPTATDIAFSLGVLMLLGSRVPLSLKIFLTALAILDDLGAVIVIAFFYTEQLSITALCMAAVTVAMLVLLNRFSVRRFWPYALLGIVLWLCVLNSGVHATLAGILLAFTIPMDQTRDERSLLEDVEHVLHPWVTFLILPLFAFANAGLSLDGMTFASLMQPVPLGIAAGLFVGKQIGIFGASALAIKLGWAKLPEQANWLGLYAVSVVCGIGFTMSLFIGSLAFKGAGHMDSQVQLGVFAGSLLAMVVGYLLLLVATKRQ